MNSILNCLQKFEEEHISWPPERFLEIQDDEIRNVVRMAFRTPTDYLVHLLEKGSVEDMNTLEENLTEHAYLMKTAALAGLLDFMYTRFKRGAPISNEILQWYEQKGWKFPAFQDENCNGNNTEKIEDKQEGGENVPDE
jgi:hypothetical protein